MDGFKSEVCNTDGQIRPAVTISAGELVSDKSGTGILKAPEIFCQCTAEALLQQPSVPDVHKTQHRWEHF